MLKWEWQAIVWVHDSHIAFLHYRRSADNNRVTIISAKHAYILEPKYVRSYFDYL